MPNLAYMPVVDRLLGRDKGQADHPQNKQAGTVKGSATLTEENALLFQERLEKLYNDAEDLYQWALQIGVPKELARLPVPVARYSRMRASANLRNWLAFLTLRMDAAAQQEIRWYANAVGELIQKNFPRTWDLFIEGKIT